MKENRFDPEDSIRAIHVRARLPETVAGQACAFRSRRRFRLHGDAVQGRQLHALVRRALRERLFEGFLGDGVEIVSYAGWIAVEQDMRRRSNQSRYNCKYFALTSHEDNVRDFATLVWSGIGAWPVSCVRFSVAQQNKSRLETRTRSHAAADSTGSTRPCWRPPWIGWSAKASRRR